jgi:hypothetical protein
MSGTGSVRKLTSGRYQVRFTDQNGQRRSYGTYQSKKAATERLRLALTQVEQDTYQPEKVRRLKEGCTNRRRNCSPITNLPISIRTSFPILTKEPLHLLLRSPRKKSLSL